MAHEDKRERFIRLAEKRVPKAIQAIRLIGNLSSRGNYSYTKEDADKIYRALENEIREMKSRFANNTNGKDVKFKL